jgi:hypothetical protein
LEEMKVHELVVKHGKTEKWIHQNPVWSMKYGQQCQVSKYHMWLYAKSLIVNQDQHICLLFFFSMLIILCHVHFGRSSAQWETSATRPSETGMGHFK